MHTFTLREQILARLNLLPLPIYDVFAAPLLGHSIALAVRLNLFETIVQPQTSEQIAETLNIHPQATSLLLSSLVTTQYVKKSGNHYILSASSRKWFLKSSPTFLGNFVRYVELLYTHWLYLSETIQHGEPPTTYIESFGEKEWEIYVYGMMDLAKIILPHIVSKMKIPRDAERLLDLGGSHGLYSIELCQRHRQLNATIVDFPHALKFSEGIIRDHALTERIALRPGNIIEMSFKKSHYDIVLAFNIVHGLRKYHIAPLLQNISSALKPGGSLYILDQFTGHQGSTIEQFIPLMVGINIMNEVGGNVYNIDELRSWSQSAGFTSLKLIRLRLPGVFLVRLQKKH